MAVLVSLFQIWINLAVGIVGNEENPANQGFFGVVVTAMACAFVARAIAVTTTPKNPWFAGFS
ncbi:MAG: hypothetical protein EOP61_14885, partial [Sphingomonadales bacterium]